MRGTRALEFEERRLRFDDRTKGDAGLDAARELGPR